MEEKRPRVYVCEDCTEGILSAVYEAYLSRYGHKYITIETENFCQPSFFCDYIQVPTDIEHGESVARAIMKKISGEAWHWVYMASMAGEPGKAQHIYRFLNMGFANPEKVCSALTQDDVLAVYKLSRKVGRETDKLMGFVRFKELSGGILFGKIAPKHQQLQLLGNHFADRLPEENWVLYDENRRMACVHKALGPWVIQKDVEAFLGRTEKISEEEAEFSHMWKTFFEHIAIDQRVNPRLQMQMMPKRFWSNMTEMK
ncbi:putative DNA metabolism protein [Catenibacillus scindens]|uniref:Putative DNA metabolism protein n=1 Tax=Catenibacillus scindens TaxID=673271 RepID=A0A7W8M3I0_9FIRM|nr:TIGR03915 family putative DNA repair protein [Catenibacillus scindens]MBB5263093.1 putative DNA metabolism protein [Catenibacillus scindens]